MSQQKSLLDMNSLQAPKVKTVQTTSNNEKVMLKLKCLGPKDGSSRKIGAKGDKTVVHGSLGILGLKMHTKLDH